MRRRSLAATSTLAAVSIVLGACGGGHKPLPTPNARNLTAPAPRACRPGQGHLGCSVPHQLGLKFNAVKLPANQGLMVDVYEGDSVYSWAQAKPHIVGAIVKAWEYRQDGKFASNWNQLRALGIWHTAYLFLHSDCSAVDRYVGAVNSTGGFNQPNTGPVTIDAETPDTRSSLGCAVARAEQLTHRVPIVYTAPGTYAGGDHKDAYLWAAGYGNYSHCPYVWTANCIAWQYTDGQYGPFPHQIPGIQPGDISVSYGIQNLVVGPPPDAYANFRKVVDDLGHNIRASEYKVVTGWDKWQCTTPTAHAAHPQICGYLHYRLVLIRGRLWAVAHQSKPANWSCCPPQVRSVRFAYVQKQIHQTKGPWKVS